MSFGKYMKQKRMDKVLNGVRSKVMTQSDWDRIKRKEEERNSSPKPTFRGILK